MREAFFGTIGDLVAIDLFRFDEAALFPRVEDRAERFVPKRFALKDERPIAAHHFEQLVHRAEAAGEDDEAGGVLGERETAREEMAEAFDQLDLAARRLLELELDARSLRAGHDAQQALIFGEGTLELFAREAHA